MVEFENDMNSREAEIEEMKAQLVQAENALKEAEENTMKVESAL
jgi:hypothetical protein